MIVIFTAVTIGAVLLDCFKYDKSADGSDEANYSKKLKTIAMIFTVLTMMTIIF